MHICIFGTGASGWITCHSLANLNFVDKITIIGSDRIPTIGVGESTTLLFSDWAQNDLGLYHDEYIKFFIEIDAAVKYGVSYEGWSHKSFLHGFYRASESFYYNSYLLANKPTHTNVNQYNSIVSSMCYNNDICFDDYSCPHAWHFDANKLIKKLENYAKKNHKISHKIGTLKTVTYDNNKIQKAILEDDTEIFADYFVNCIGSTSFNQQIFNEEYESYSDVLLTNKAVFAPIDYKNKRKEFHPYTKAKTMKNGWRWITPTWSRIGTGYVFSDRYCTVDEAKTELLKDIGANSKQPLFEVDFLPRKVKKVYKDNSCTIGMASGFLEPLDAPGLDLTIKSVNRLKSLLINFHEKKDYRLKLEENNEKFDFDFNFWASFILLQYKTCYRNDTKFWNDHKKINFYFFESLYNELEETFQLPWSWEKAMFYHTLAGKDINWKIPTNEMPKFITDKDFPKMNHYDALRQIRHRFKYEDIISL